MITFLIGILLIFKIIFLALCTYLRFHKLTIFYGIELILFIILLLII